MKKTKFYHYLLPFWKIEALILFFNAAIVCLDLINPYLSKLIIDKAYANKNVKLFINLILFGAGIFILSSILAGLTRYLNQYITLKMNFNLNNKVFRQLQRLPYSFSQESSTGKRMFNLIQDINNAVDFTANILPQGILLIPKSMLILIIIFFLNWKIALLALALTPFLYLAPYYFNKKLRKVFTAYMENYEGIFSRLKEALSHTHMVKSFGKENKEILIFAKKMIKNMRFRLYNAKLEATGSLTNSVTNHIALGIIVVYGGFQVIKGRLTLGAFTTIAIYMKQLSGIQSSLGHLLQQISLGLVSYNRLDNILNAQQQAKKEESGSREIIFPKGAIQFNKVTFGYEASQDKRILNGINFDIPGGSCIGIVGPSGKGKTTIINLLLTNQIVT